VCDSTRKSSEITSQNHGFADDPTPCPPTCA
jgi:carbamoylphosphate synthase small subunit